MKLIALSLAATFVVAPFTFAQNNYIEDDDDYFVDFYGSEELVEIATGTKKHFHLLPAVASVITSDDIELMGANTIHQLIESVTGIHTYPSSLNRMNPSYSIRGIHTNENQQVLVLVNGIETSYEYTGAKWNIFDVGVNIVERVEIIRGPGSAVYGADAFSGVINIITKGNNNLFNNNVGVKTGSFGTKSAWFNYGYEKDDLKFSANAQFQRTDGDNNRVVQSDLLHLIGLKDISNAPGSLDTRHKYMDIHTQLDYKGFYTHLWYLNLSGGTGAGAAQALSNNDITQGEQISIKTGYSFNVNKDLTTDINIQYQNYEQYTYFKIFPDGYIDRSGINYEQGFIGVPTVEDKVYKTSLTSTYIGFEQHTIRLETGFQYSKETTDELKNFGPGIIQPGQLTQNDILTSVKNTPYIFIGDNSRRLRYLSLQDEWKFANDWELTTGVRIDDYSDFGTTINPRLAMIWQTKQNLTSKILYGSAYRAPSFGDLYAANNPVQLGNENLSPETIDTIELAFDYRLNVNWKILINIFRYQSKDLITYVNGQLQNALKQNGKGVELESDWQVTNDLNIKLGLAVQKSKDTNNNEISDAPAQTFDIKITWKINDDLSLYTDTSWINNRHRAVEDNRQKIKNYTWTNLNLLYRFSSFKINLSARNVFDVNAKEASNGRIKDDYPLEGRGYWVTLNKEF